MKFGFSFSLKRALGITAAKQKISKKTGIPLTKQGAERKIGSVILNSIFGKNKNSKENFKVKSNTYLYSQTS